MSQPQAIEIARDNALFDLEQGMSESAQAGHRDPELLVPLSAAFHTLGIVALLADANRAEFARMLAFSGQVDRHCRQLDLAEVPEILIASRGMPFADALAAGDLQTARAIAARCPIQALEGYEYEDDFLKHAFLHRMLLAPDDLASLRALLARWSEVARGDVPPSHEVCRALLERDAVALDQALTAFAAKVVENLEAWRRTPSYRAEHDATEGGLSTMGLAYLRMAEVQRIPTRSDYDLMPSLARVKMGAEAPPPDAWRRFDPALA